MDGIFWLVVGDDVYLLGGGGYFLGDGGGWWWLFFGWWLVMLGGGTVYDINIIYLLYIYYPILFTIGLLHQKKKKKYLLTYIQLIR